ncbi:MAG: 50S ribosomal protein L24 [Myxococcota bacterium]
MAARIKKDDMVVVIAGADKGVTGRVLKVLPEEDRVVVEGVRRAKRHQSPRMYREGGIVEREAPIHVSNVMLVDPKAEEGAEPRAKATRVRFGTDAEGKKVRIAAKSGAVVDTE